MTESQSKGTTALQAVHVLASVGNCNKPKDIANFLRGPTRLGSITGILGWPTPVS